MKKQLLFGIFGLLFLVQAIGQGDGFKLVSLVPHLVSARDGTSYAGEKGLIKVPENRDRKTTKYLELPFFRIKTTHKNPLPPIFIFEGGPGDNPSALQRLSEFVPLIKSFAERSDVVLVEQRGNGGAVPRLRCKNTLELPLNTPLTLASFGRAYRAYMAACIKPWQQKGRDLAGYNVISMADDIEAVRQALSYERIMLFGGSFGSHHALTYIKRYPNNVERVLLDSPEGLLHTVKIPSSADTVLVQLSALVKTNTALAKEIPSFMALVKDILNKLEATPVSVKTRHPITNEEVTIVLGKFDLQFVTAQDLGRIGYRALPLRYLEMKQGDYSWLARRAIGLRVSHTESLMAALTDNASAAVSPKTALVKDQTQSAVLGNALNNVIFEVKGLLPLKDISKELNQCFKSDVPILLICGQQDARTPLSNAKEILTDFKNGSLLVVEHGSHDLFREALDQLLPIMQRYLMAEDPMEYRMPAAIVAPLNLLTQ